MTELACPAGVSGAVERGVVREVAALGNALTELFNTLGLSQNAYAVRVSLDKSIVSRFLRGRRIATQDFVDRLVREVEENRGAPVKPEAKDRLAELRLAALRACDPDVYELESLRAEMRKSRREVEMLVRHQEALHDLLDKRESEIDAVQGELERVRRDGVTEYVRAEQAEMELRERTEHHSAERGRLVDEVARLKRELAEVAAMKEQAEQRCADLETRVREMEEELAHSREGAGEASHLPFEAFVAQLEHQLDVGDQRGVTREATQAAWERPIKEVIRLMAWFGQRQDFSRRDRIVVDVVHSRSLDDLAAFGTALRPLGFPRPRSRVLTPAAIVLLNEEVVAIRSVEEIATLHTRWAEPDRKRRVTRRDLMATLVKSDRSVGDVARVIARLGPDDELSNRHITQAAETVEPGRLAALIPLLAGSDREDLVAPLCRALTQQLPLRSAIALDMRGLENMSEEHAELLVRALLRAVTVDAVVVFLARICDAYDQGHRAEPVVTAFFDALKSAGGLADVASFVAKNKGRRLGLPSACTQLHMRLRAWSATGS
ncbi:hypothetical protein AB0C13_10380 [Streptomyces sp. NPDC049099]|uniref:hypothetical protein n=1 Tax=Streptomyces sp. NPDC049099 TaxID=3155768 RepID=UPI003449385D